MMFVNVEPKNLTGLCDNPNRSKYKEKIYKLTCINEKDI